MFRMAIVIALNSAIHSRGQDNNRIPATEFGERTAERRALPRNPILVAHRRAHHYSRIAMGTAVIHHVDPAACRVQIERRTFDLVMHGRHHVGVDVSFSTYTAFTPRRCR